MTGTILAGGFWRNPLRRSSCTVISEMLELGKEGNPPYFDDFTKKPQYYTKINLY